MTAFVAVDDRRRSEGVAEITYWLYRPTLGWERSSREATLGARSPRSRSTPLLDDAVPALVALETLDGRNQYEFAAGEEPPWRWRVESAYPRSPMVDAPTSARRGAPSRRGRSASSSPPGRVPVKVPNGWR